MCGKHPLAIHTHRSTYIGGSQNFELFDQIKHFLPILILSIEQLEVPSSSLFFKVSLPGKVIVIVR
jgi:hypothetical protein